MFCDSRFWSCRFWTAIGSVLNFCDCPQFVIEREIPGAGARSEAQIREVSLLSLQTLKEMGPQIQWLHSYVTKVYCVYLAPEEDSIREHARRVGIPADRVAAVRRCLPPRRAISRQVAVLDRV